MTLQQQLAEMREEARYTRDDAYRTSVHDNVIKLVDTLQAILDIEKKVRVRDEDEFDEGARDGYNSALATVAEVVREGMGG